MADMLIDELKTNVLGMILRMDRRQKIGAAMAILSILLIVAGIGYWALHTSYGVLFSDLNDADAANIITELKQDKIPYQLQDRGHRILIPQDKVRETRIQLMGKGVLMSGTVGFEIFDKKDLGMTEYTQRIDYQRALQGELERTIMSLAPVKFARVELVLPQTSIFRQNQIKPKGSVTLILRPGAQLLPEQILGIQRLVAASVPGVEPGAVTILDQRGITLSGANDGEEEGAATGSNLQMKRKVEDYLTRKIMAVMDRTYGPGKAIVSVDVALNFDEIHRTDQDVIPLNAEAGDATGVLVRKRQSVYRQGQAVPNPKTGNGEQVNATTDLKSTTDVEYEVSHRVEQVVTAPGGIRRISVGILLPGKVDKQELANVKQIVTMVAGLNLDRGDAIVVRGIDQLTMGDDHIGGVQPAVPVGPVATPPPVAKPVALGGTLQEWVRSHINRVQAAALAFALLVLLSLAFNFVRWRRRAGDAQRRKVLLAEIRQWMEAE